MRLTAATCTSVSQLVVVGANVKLGAWNPLNGVPLTRVNAHSSALSAQVGGFFPGTAIKFKVSCELRPGHFCAPHSSVHSRTEVSGKSSYCLLITG